MKNVTVRKDELKAKIAENRAAHRAIFEEAVEGYKAEATRLLEGHIERVKKGKLEEVRVYLPRPSDHTKDYDRVLAMLEMEVEDTIEIDQSTFGAYVMDDWAWKDDFLTSNSAYSVTAARLSS